MKKTTDVLTRPRLIWTGSGIFILVLHVVTLISLPLYLSLGHPTWSMYLTAIAVLYLSIGGITGGYHRLYSHRAYQLARPVEALLLFFGTLALQGSALRWSFDHRAHHRHADHDGDPYNVRVSFWHAHVLWLYCQQPPIDKTVNDLAANPLLRWQHRHYGLLAILSNAIVSLAAGWFLHDLVGGFVLVFGTRLVVSYHLTWFINSLAHYWGSRSYCKEMTARDNNILAPITFGEGFHNFHHTFPSDYRNGIRWFHVDPGKWIIWCLSKCGLAWGLKRQPREKIERTQIHLDTELVLQRLRDAAATGAADFRAKLEKQFGPIPKVDVFIVERSNALKTRVEEIARLREAKRALRSQHSSRSEYRALNEHLGNLRRDFQARWAEWCRLCGVILQT